MPNKAQAKELRERIVIEARAAFFERGFRGVSMEDIAGRLGISKKTLYLHFRSKDDLVGAVLDLNMKTIMPRMLDIIQSGQRPDRKLVEVSRTALSLFPKYISPVMMADLKKYYPHLWQRVEKTRARVIMQYARVLEEGKRSRVFRADLDTDLVNRMLLLCIQGIINPEYLSENKLGIPEAVTTIFEVFSRGILSPKYRRKR